MKYFISAFVFIFYFCSISFAGVCYEQTMKMKVVNNDTIYIPVRIKYEFKIFSNKIDAELYAKNNSLENNIIFNSTDNVYLVFDKLPNRFFVCTFLKEN